MDNFWTWWAGFWQLVRLFISIGMFGLAFREVFIRRKDGIMTGFLIATVGIFIASAYSVSDSVALLMPEWKHYSAMAWPGLRLAVIGTSTMLFDIGALIIIRWLFWPKPKPTRKRITK